MKRGEIWRVSPDPTAGHEQKGRRPVLIVSPEPFNRVTKVPVVLPITSRGNFARMAGFAVPLTGAGTKTTGVVRCDQPRVIDLGARDGTSADFPDWIWGGLSRQKMGESPRGQDGGMTAGSNGTSPTRRPGGCVNATASEPAADATR